MTDLAPEQMDWGFDLSAPSPQCAAHHLGVSRLRATERVLPLLEAAANAGDPCPTNRLIADILGWRSTAQSVAAIIALERAGAIAIQRFRASRIVTIIATGKSTATPTDITPHWRDRNQKSQPRHLGESP